MVETKCVGLKTCAGLDIMWMFGPSVADPEPHGSKITCQIRPLAAVLVFIFRTCTYTLGEILSMLDCCSPWRTWTSRRTAILVGSWCCCSSELLQHHGWAGRILSSRALSPSHRLHMQTKMSETFWNILMFPRYNIFLFSQPTNAKGVNIFMVIYTVLQCNLPPITPHWEAETHLLRPAHLLPAYLHCRSYNLHACNTPIFVPYSKCLHTVLGSKLSVLADLGDAREPLAAGGHLWCRLLACPSSLLSDPSASLNRKKNRL